MHEHACPYFPGVAYQTKSVLKRHIETVHEKRRDHVCPNSGLDVSTDSRIIIQLWQHSGNNLEIIQHFGSIMAIIR